MDLFESVLFPTLYGKSSYFSSKYLAYKSSNVFSTHSPSQKLQISFYSKFKYVIFYIFEIF